MARWEPDSRGRLEQAAMELYAERGYQETTVEEIADRAGLTKRTFFRHFADKREVLFGGAPILHKAVLDALAAAPEDLDVLEVVATGLAAAGTVFIARDLARQRTAIIDANDELQERELIKLARLSAAIADALRARGIGDPAAALAADAGLSVFHLAFQRWIATEPASEFAPFVSEALSELRAVAAPV